MKVDDPSSLFRGKEHGAHERQGVKVFMHKGRGLVDFFFNEVCGQFPFDQLVQHSRLIIGF